VKSWIFVAVLALAMCTCGLLIADEEEGSESPATSESVEQEEAKKEAAPAKKGAEAPSTSATPSESKAPAKPHVEED
jgi:hypothetical protein